MEVTAIPSIPMKRRQWYKLSWKWRKNNWIQHGLRDVLVATVLVYIHGPVMCVVQFLFRYSYM